MAAVLFRKLRAARIYKEKLMSYVDSAEQTRKSSRNVLTKHLNSIITNDAIKNMLSQNDIDLEM